MHSVPWFREFDGWWYFYRRAGGKRQPVKLVKGKQNKAAALDRWHELCRKPAEQPLVSSTAVVALLDLYLDWCQRNRSRGTYAIYRHHLQSFCGHIGPELLVDELWPKHVTSWLATLIKSDSTKAGAAQTVRSAFNWLAREGHVRRNPVAAARGPSKRPRELILSDDDFAAVIQHSQPDFVQLLTFLRLTGCRPQEANAIEVRHCDLANSRIVLPPSEAKGKKHPRVIFLCDQALAIVQQQLGKYHEGPILRTCRGKRWDRNKVRCRFRRLREKVGGKFCAYHLRHTFATKALQRLDPITVAVLMGHSDASTLARNYQHLAKLPAHMRDAAEK